MRNNVMGGACDSAVKTSGGYRGMEGTPEGKRVLGILDIHGSIILKQILNLFGGLELY